MITEQQIIEKAKEEAQRNIVDYAPHSYQAGFIACGMWILKLLNQNNKH